MTLTGNGYTGLTIVTGGGSLVLGPLAQNPISIGGADVQSGSLVFQYSGTSPAPAIESILATSYQHNFAAGSGQIFSSTVAANGLTLGWSDDGSSAVTITADAARRRKSRRHGGHQRPDRGAEQTTAAQAWFGARAISTTTARSMLTI